MNCLAYICRLRMSASNANVLAKRNIDQAAMNEVRLYLILSCDPSSIFKLLGLQIGGRMTTLLDNMHWKVCFSHIKTYFSQLS